MSLSVSGTMVGSSSPLLFPCKLLLCTVYLNFCHVVLYWRIFQVPKRKKGCSKKPLGPFLLDEFGDDFQIRDIGHHFGSFCSLWGKGLKVNNETHTDAPYMVWQLLHDWMVQQQANHRLQEKIWMLSWASLFRLWHLNAQIISIQVSGRLGGRDSCIATIATMTTKVTL